MKKGNFWLGVALVMFSFLPLLLVFFHHDLPASMPVWFSRAIGLLSLAAYPLGLFALWNATYTHVQGFFLIFLLGTGGLLFLFNLAITVLLAFGSGPSPG